GAHLRRVVPSPRRARRTPALPPCPPQLLGSRALDDDAAVRILDSRDRRAELPRLRRAAAPARVGNARLRGTRVSRLLPLADAPPRSRHHPHRPLGQPPQQADHRRTHGSALMTLTIEAPVHAPSTTALEIRELRVSYRPVHHPVEVVHGVTLSVSRGRTLALVGQSGSGKSTIALAAAGLLPKRGAITGG